MKLVRMIDLTPVFDMLRLQLAAIRQRLQGRNHGCQNAIHRPGPRVADRRGGRELYRSGLPEVADLYLNDQAETKRVGLPK